MPPNNLSRKLLGVTSLLMILSVTMVGQGYALWRTTLTDSGIVYTGDFDASWIAVSCAEFHTWPNLPTNFPDDFGEFEGKNVGSTNASIDSTDPSLIHFNADNTYPSYAVDCEVHFQNTGSIPWIIQGTTIQAVSSNLENCSLTGNHTKTLACDELTVIYGDGIGMQVDPGDGGASSLMVHVEQPADPDSTYEFEMQVCVSQWNESATASECFAAVP